MPILHVSTNRYFAKSKMEIKCLKPRLRNIRLPFPDHWYDIAQNILTDHIPHSLLEEMLKKDEKKIRQGFFFKNTLRGNGVFKGESIVNVFLYFI
ncbi:hypothetical protein I7I50_10911 [Histoplasma capsulatum G186AR]|uniref:Uncharacterized protein n=1 Tax=Ajellomyces capsulatus TaxID=5037 RepID=A0A8H8D704_AJECA|nr:hypothetical protein I7I52_02149 [Histoplasma capsulatum]QSS69575.1 hypothetical protein I7I50_10911 [Histoplasma capsulatum G186AR]